ncbi:alpha-2-macroglobulin family protein [Trichocoleus sp. ST-U2]|uniref:alpha-2-macroglobulin family protein n=2 Tax=Cyanobacteriota TaxID=1117 RepID=UPI0030D845EA
MPVSIPDTDSLSSLLAQDSTDKSFQQIGTIVRIWMRFLVVVAFVLGIAGCGVINLSGNEPLPAVPSLATPQLPDWIEEISPTSEVEPLAQIRIRFKDALIPVESLDSPDQQQKLKQFEILPPLPGQFRFLTPRMVGFQADKALPKATRVRVTLKAGLADLKNHRLDKDLAWTFNTEPIKLTNLPTTNPENPDNQAIDLKPTLKFNSNVELDVASVQEHLKLIPEGKQKDIRLKVDLEKKEIPSENEQPQEKLDPSTRNWTYNLVPQQTLEKATRYRLEFSPGLRPTRGNLPSEMSYVSQLATYSPLKLLIIKYYGVPDAGGTYGRFVKGSPQLQFNNGLDADSAIENITVTPAPKEAPKLVQVPDGESLVNLNPWALEPATTYTITIGKKLKDKFGQTLEKPVTLKYETGDVAGDIWVPSNLNIFPAGNDLQLNVSTVNLPESKYKAAYRVLQPTDLVYVDSAYPKSDGNDLLPNPNSWQSVKVSSKKNQLIDVPVPIQEKLGTATGMLAYGVQARTNRYEENGKQQWREPTTYGMVELTNLGVFAQWFPDSGLIRVHHLSDGSPVASAPVEIYESKLEAKSRPQPVPCASGKTDEAGTLLLRREDMQQCTKSSSGFEQGPKLLVIARENQDWAFVRTEEYSGAYGYGVDAGWDDGKPVSRGVIFSDRQLYQPGEKASFTGFAYYLQNGNIQQDKNASYKVTLLNPDGQKTDLGTQTTNEFGSFSLEVPFKTNQPLGYYSIQAKGKSGVEVLGDFRVAEFKPPNFKVELNLDKEFALKDQQVEAKSTSNYLFGAPVEGGKAEYYVTRSQADFKPKGWEQFSFGRQWFWPEESPTVSSDVLQSNQVLDGKGNSQIVKIAKDVPYPMTYRVDVQVSDVSNLSVSDSKTFTVLPSDRLIGLQSNFVADALQSLPVQVIVTDPTGKVMEGQRVRVELQQMKYSSVTRVVEGSNTAKNQVEYKTVAQTEVKSGNNPQSVSLTPPESGSYRIRANFANTKDEVTATDLQIWATGGNAVTWGESDRDRLEVKLDKDTYKPGETATALIQSPYPEAELYFAVVRDKPLYKTITKVKGGAPQIQFQVTPEMLPNAAVEAVLVRQGVPLSQVEPGSLENLVRIGFAPFKTNLDDKYLKVQVTPIQTQLEPGVPETVQLELKDAQGNPAQGQFTVMAVNEAVLQLSGYRPPDLVQTVYAEQPISTRFSDNRPNVVVQPTSMTKPKGWGYGGGQSAGAANTRTRKDFQALAYYNGSVLTDATGKAEVTFKLPDDLTTWRVMAVATDGNLHFGNGEATFITTKPLLSNPILPQFARPGDRLEAGLSVTNNTQQTGNLAINGVANGSLQFANKPANLQTKAESGTRAYRFPIVAGSAGKSQVKFTTQLNGTADAFEVPLEVKALEITEQVVESGTTTNQVKIPLNVDKKVVPDAGGLEISLASTLIPEITAPARQVLQDEQLPFLEPAASQLAIASSLQTLSQKYGQTFAQFNPTQQANQSLEHLQKLQQPDGGFAAWPGQQKSDPLVSPYAAQALARASKAGLTVEPRMVSRLTTYLKKILADPGQYDFCKQPLCKNQVRLEALSALAELGEKRNDFLADIYAQRSQFDPVTQIKLAHYLSQFPEWQEESQTLSKQFQQNIYQTGRTATVNLPQGLSWLNSSTTAQAQALRLAIAQKSNPEILDRLLQSLLALRRNGTWQNTYDNAQALTALVEYSQTQPTPPNFAAMVKLAGKKLTSAQFKGYTNPSQDLKVPMTQLPRDRHDLIVQKSGQGTLHYLVAYRYRLQGNQPGRFNGLRVTREIRPASEEKVLRKLSLYASDEPLTVKSGQVFDIGLEIITDHPVNRVVISDPLPAGFEAVDASFQTSTAALQAKEDNFGFKTIYRDRIVAYSDRLEAGVYSLHYLVRSVTPGTFLWPGAEAHLQYAPEEFGRSASSTLKVSD